MIPPRAPEAPPARDHARRRWLLTLAAAPLLGTALAACDARRAAPEFSYTLLDGTPGSSAALRGKVVLVNFWATSCVSCVKEMPALVETHEKFRERGFETLAVAMSYDPPAFVANFARTRALPFGVVIDNTGAIARGFGDVQLTPTTFLIDKRGRIVKRYVGEPDFPALHRLVDRLLGEA
jgi:peroxiredoxin